MTYCKKHLLILSAGVFMYFTGNAQQSGQNNAFQKLIEPLTGWADSLPQEKVYLHTDKPYYAIGDTIWFKAYVVQGSRRRLSLLSEALYADLITETGTIAGELKLPVVAGTASGYFALSPAFEEGNYRIRAYTQWMRNAGPDYFYDQTFPVGNGLSQTVTAGITYERTLEKGAKVLTAVLNYQDAVTGGALAGCKVEYVLHKGLKEYTGRGETGDSGSLRFAVPDDFQSGSYILSIIEKKDGQSVAKTFPLDRGAGTEVQFFPEGGNLVNGLSSRVAFKATGPDGLGVPVSGFIFNDLQDTLAALKSRHAGMGAFTITPAAGRRYYAEISYPGGSKGKVSLPEPKEAGYVLWAYPNRDNDTLLVRIMAGKEGFGPVSLLVHSGGEVLDALTLNVNRPLSRLRIPTGHFPSGIAELTLFDVQNRPVCERIVFIENADTLNLALSTEPENHTPRGQVKMSLLATGKDNKGVIGTFSVAVIDENKVPLDGVSENTIFSQLLLKSDIRGYIEDPGYYFKAAGKERREHLDLLMITQGYRRFVWKELLEDTNYSPEYQAERRFSTVSGKLVTLGEKPVAGGQITLLSNSGMMLKEAVTNSAGRFSFEDIPLGRDISFTVQGRTAKGGKKVKVIMDPVAGPLEVGPNPNRGDLRFWINKDMQTYLANSGMTQQVNVLQGVTVTGNQGGEEEGGLYAMLSGHADQTVRFTNPGACNTVLLCLQGRLQGVTFRDEGNGMAPYSRGEGMSLFLNGRQITNALERADILENGAIAPTDIERVDVVRTNVALMSIFRTVENDMGSGGALLIKTRSGLTRSPRYSPDIVNFTLRGFDVTKEFYAPRYDRPAANSPADLRSTIYWNPYVVTAKDGKAGFDFFNADGPGTYRVVVEGIGSTGQLGRKILRYNVE